MFDVKEDPDAWGDELADAITDVDAAADKFHAHQQKMLDMGILPALVKAELDYFEYATRKTLGSATPH